MGEATGGAAIREKGTMNGTASDANGKYSLKLSQPNAVLEVSFMGFQKQEVRVAGRKVVDIKLIPDSKLLNEVVTVGYGTMKKSDITGSVVSVDREQMMKKIPTNIGQALQGAAAGVIVTAQDGAPDANSAIRIRGIGTINGTADPLYVVDGVKVGTNANFINPADIETIEVLKDASATAIYGAEGANGVIMITTKHGEKGKTRVSFNADFGIQTLAYKLETLGIEDYADAVREAVFNQTGSTVTANALWDPQYDGKRNYINWQDQMTRSALRQQYGLSASGGSEKSTYNFSLGYLDYDGIVVGTNMNRFTLRANMTAQPTKYLKVGGDVNYVHRSSKGSNIGIGNNGNMSSLRDYAFWSPTLDYVQNNLVGSPIQNVNVVNPNGTYGAGQLFVTDTRFEGNTTILHNPYATQKEAAAARTSRFNRVFASAFAEITFMKGLTFKTIGSFSYYGSDTQRFEGGYQRFNLVAGQYKEMDYSGAFDNALQMGLDASSSYSMGIESFLTYNYSDDIHNLTLMLGNDVRKSHGQWVGGSAKDFLYETNRVFGLAQNVEKSNGGFNADSRNISYFGRAIYSLMDRYIVTATLRRDGSSNFGPGNRWGTFPSVAAAWRVKEESFLKDVDAIHNLKVRFGWGQTGNSGIRSGAAVAALSSGIFYNFYGQNGQMGLGTNMNRQPGLFAGLVDTNLKWETNEQVNYGIDLGFLGGDLTMTFDYFIRNSKDLLLDFQVRPSTGFSQVYTNYGNIRNSGLEFAINYRKQLNNDFGFNVGLNASTLRNRVTKMGEPLKVANTDGGNVKWNTVDGSNIGGVGDPNGWMWGEHSWSQEGGQVGAFYGYRTDGIIQNEQELAEYKAYFTSADGEWKSNATEVNVGDFRFKDLNGDHVLDESDREILGHGIPAFTYGLTLGATYKNWDFSAYMNGVFGQDIFSYSAMRLSTTNMGDDQTFPNILKDSWASVAHVKDGVVTNPGATLPRLGTEDRNYNMRASDAWVKNGNFFRLSNLQIGYTFNQDFLKNIGIESARIYGAISNLFVISPYTKYGDPEVGQGSVLYSGFDTGRYPMPRTFQFGLSVNF